MKSFALACLAVVSSALDLEQAHPWAVSDLNLPEEPEAFDLGPLEAALNAGKLVPVEAIDKEILVVDVYDEEDEDEDEEEEDSEDEDDDEVEQLKPEAIDVEAVLEQVAKGFEGIQADNKLIEDADIAQTQEDQEADIDAIIEDAKDLVAATVIDDDLDLGDLTGILEAQAKEID